MTADEEERAYAYIERRNGKRIADICRERNKQNGNSNNFWTVYSKVIDENRPPPSDIKFNS